MFVTSAEQRAGLLVAIITGGRPKLEQRPTGEFVADMKAAGVGDVVWVVSDRDADGYERDDCDLAVYSHKKFAYPYAREHWMRVEPPEPDGFYGAFPGREWACREAERRGFWGVLQLDDNILRVALRRVSKTGIRVTHENGGMGLVVDMLAAMALSTNARTVGAQLGSVNPTKYDAPKLIRPGFPYSLFIERVGPTREPWYGPYEDDITHSFQYGDRADGATAAVMPGLVYAKESKSTTGMRAKYDATRSVQLQRLMPQGAKVGVRASRSNGRGGPRVFHTMPPGAIRNPVTVRNRRLYTAAAARMGELTTAWFAAEMAYNQGKSGKRLERLESTAEYVLRMLNQRGFAQGDFCAADIRPILAQTRFPNDRKVAAPLQALAADGRLVQVGPTAGLSTRYTVATSELAAQVSSGMSA
jgi:hypothetical protein